MTPIRSLSLRGFLVHLTMIAGLLVAALPAQHYFVEDFEGKTFGSLCPNASCANSSYPGGWAAWNDDPNVAGDVSSDHALSGTLGLRVTNGQDSVQPFALNDPSGHPQSGRWRFVVRQWIDGASFTPGSGSQLVIVNTIYNHGGPHAWAIQLEADPDTGTFFDADRLGNSISVATDRWVEVAMVIDLDQDLLETSYDGQIVSTGSYLLATSYGGGPLAIANLDLFAEPGSSIAYYDDIALGRYEYQVNTPQASLDINGYLSDGAEAAIARIPFGAPLTVSFASSVPGTYSDTIIGFLPLLPASGGAALTAGGQLINMDLFDPGLSFLNTGSAIPFPTAFPGSFQVPFFAPTVPIHVSIQSFYLDPSTADGFRLSQATTLITDAPASRDYEPPAVAVTNISAGQSYVLGASVVPTIVAIDVQDPNPTITAWLDDAPYLPGTPITAEGHHNLSVRAVDATGNVGVSEPCWFEILPFPRLQATCVIESFSSIESGPWASLQATILLASSAFNVQDIALYGINLWGLNANGLPLNREPIPIAGSRDPIAGGYNYSTTQATYQNGYWRLIFSATLFDQALIGSPTRLRITGTGLHGQSGEFDLEGETLDVIPSPNAVGELQQMGLVNGDPPAPVPPAPQWPACKWKSKIVKKSPRDSERRDTNTSCAYPQQSSVNHYAQGETFAGTMYALDGWCFGSANESSSVTGHLIMKVYLEGPDDCCNPQIEITAIPTFKAEVSIDPPGKATAAGAIDVKSTIGTSATARGGVSEGDGGSITLNMGAGVSVGKDGPSGGVNIGVTTTYTGDDQNDESPQGLDTDQANVRSAIIAVGTSSKLVTKADGHALNIYAVANADLTRATPNVTIICTCLGGCGATKTFTIK